jgi:hypothetical protein
MTNEEVERLIARAEKRLRSEKFVPSAIAGALALSSVPALAIPEVGPIVVVFAGACGLISALELGSVRYVRHRLGENKALWVWKKFMRHDTFGAKQFKSSKKLQQAVLQIYKNDPQGDVLPLRQAMSLLDAHCRQQERLGAVAYYLKEMQLLKQTMHGKLAQLRKLGEDAPESKRRLTQLERDEAALQSIHNQIAASCARLETIFTSVQHAHQVRQLKRELGELSQVAGSGSDLALESDAFDIERQIGREIETFLQLERETDEHLRDV